MEPLAFVEIVDRHRDVLARHAVYRWPARIGRGYEADVILDDPFVAPLHAAIEPAGMDRFRISDLGSRNGITLAATEQRVDTTEVGPDDVTSLGHTQIRIRTTSYTVPQERPLLRVALYRRPAAFALLAALYIVLLLWNGWVLTNEDDERYVLYFGVLGMVALLAVWISVWSFVSNVTGRLPHFTAHGFVACAGVVALTTSDSVFEYLSFAFDATWLDYVSGAAAAAVLAYMIYRHLLLNSRARRKTLAFVGAVTSVAICGTFAGLELVSDRALDTKQRYNGTIKAPVFLFASGTSPETFMSDAEALKNKVDAMVRTK